MTYNKRGKRNSKKSILQQQQEQQTQQVQLLGRTRKNKVLTQSDYITPNLYPADYNSNLNIWTLAIDVGKKNMGFAIYDRHTVKFGLFNIEEQIKIDKLDKLKIDAPTKRIKVLLKWFKNLIKRYHIVELVVEKQVLKNGIAMQLENVLLTLACENDIHFKIYDPKNKFQYIPIEFRSEIKEHKKISIHYAFNIIYNLGQDLEYFASFDKKDDISDAICMAVMSREPDENKIRYLITDHTNNILLSQLNKTINFKQLIQMNIIKITAANIEKEEIITTENKFSENKINWCMNEFKKMCVENGIVDEKYELLLTKLNCDFIYISIKK